jgi:hypothetical protein
MPGRMWMTPRPGRPHPLVVAALFAALSIVWTWPLSTHITSRIAFDPGDPLLNTWILWWNAQAIPFTDEWWNPPIFFPMRGALALSEHLAGVAVFTTPLLLLGGSPALAYNVALLLSYALSGFFAYLLVRHLTGSTAAAICAGLAYGFAPFRAGQLSHLQVLTSQWMPLMLLGLHRYLATSRRRWLAVFGAAWVLQALSNGYYLLFLPVLLFLWFLWFVVAPRRWREARAIAAAFIVSSLALVPTLLEYREIHSALGLVRGRTEIMQFNAHAGSFLNPPHMLAFWPPRNVPTIEDFLFPGVTVVALALAGLVLTIARSGTDSAMRRMLMFYVGAAVIMAALAFGPAAPDAGLAGWLRPYEWLVRLPGYNGLRVPVRYAMLMALCISVAGGLALRVLLPAAARWRAAVLAVAIAGIVADGFMDPMPVSPAPGRVELPRVPAATVLELPPDDASVSVGAMFRSMSHRLPLINGYSGHIPTHYGILCQSLRRDDPSAVIELARGRTLLIIVSERRDPGGYFRRLVESIPGVQRGDVSGAGMSFILRAQPRDRRPSGGTPHPFTVSKQPRSHVVLDLGAPRVVRSIEFTLREFWPEFGRRFAIETSPDGAAWQTIWEDWTGGAALAGALEDQVRVPVQLTLPDVTTRYLRLHPVEDWLLRDLRVLGP